MQTVSRTETSIYRQKWTHAHIDSHSCSSHYNDQYTCNCYSSVLTGICMSLHEKTKNTQSQMICIMFTAFNTCIKSTLQCNLHLIRSFLNPNSLPKSLKGQIFSISMILEFYTNCVFIILFSLAFKILVLVSGKVLQLDL